MAGSFESLVARLPWDIDTITGRAVGFFLRRQDPESIEFVTAANGYMIKVRTEKEGIDEAQEFWETYVQPNLDGESE